MKYFLLLLLLIGEGLCGALQWNGEAPGGFSVLIDVSKEKMTLLDSLTIELELSYPETHHVDMAAVRNHLFQHFGFSESPFALISERFQPIEKKGHIQTIKAVFELEPQYGGNHVISFLNIPFESKEAKTNSKVEIFSALFEIEVDMPPELKENDLLIAPLLTFSTQLPIHLDAYNRLEQQKNNGWKRTQQLFHEKQIPWLAFLMISALIIGWRMSKKSKGKSAKEQKKMQASAKKQALWDLNELKHNHESNEAFFTALTDIIRSFIEKSYDF
jgi:hypothetical protein